MTIIEYLRTQFIDEGNITREFLSRLRNEHLSFQPHPKSMDLKALASHLADLPGWMHLAITTTELDFATNPEPAPLPTVDAIKKYFEESYEKGLSVLVPESEAVLQEPWTLRHGDNIFLTVPKVEMMRIAASQQIHHRAQVGVYMRLLNVPIPGSYGPSADENTFM